jgi:hypothetical protein
VIFFKLWRQEISLIRSKCPVLKLTEILMHFWTVLGTSGMRIYPQNRNPRISGMDRISSCQTWLILVFPFRFLWKAREYDSCWGYEKKKYNRITLNLKCYKEYMSCLESTREVTRIEYGVPHPALFSRKPAPLLW